MLTSSLLILLHRPTIASGDTFCELETLGAFYNCLSPIHLRVIHELDVTIKMSDEDRESQWSADDHPRYPPAPDWNSWHTERLPAEDEVAFQALIFRMEIPGNHSDLIQALTMILGRLESSGSTSSARVKYYENEDQCATWQDAPNSKCYASFGDNGTTASVGAYGHLMQISQYLEAGRSGMFALVSRVTDEPRWPLSRVQDLQEMSQNRSATSAHDNNHISVGLELNIRGLRSKRRRPQLKWVHWRWPRFEYQLPKLKLKVAIQWMVREHVVLQQWVVRNEGDDDISVPVKLGRDMWIQDMEYMDYSNNFNNKKGAQGQFGLAGPHGYGWLLMHPFDDAMCPTLQTTCEVGINPSSPAQSSRERMYNLEEKTDDLEPRALAVNELPRLEKDRPIATAVMGVFVDGKARRFESEESRLGQWEETVKRGTAMEVTAAYKLILVPKEAVDYRNFLIPVAAANVSQFLAEETPISLYSLSSIELGRRHFEAPPDRGEDNSYLAPAGPTLQPKGTKWNESISTTNLDPLETQLRTRRLFGLPTPFSTRNYIDFAVWRNLEHILSVCAIPHKAPVLVEHQDETTTGLYSEKCTDAVALTCGDFSGHRLYNPAS